MGASGRSFGLRSMATAAMVGTTLMLIIVAAALVLLTNALHRSATELRDAVISVRLAEEAEIDLLLHDRAKDRLLRLDLENDLRRKLARAQDHVTSEQEGAALAAATTALEEHFRSRRSGVLSEAERVRRLEAAHEALHAMVRVNVAQAEIAQRRSAQWDEIGSLIGISAIMLAVLVSVVVLFWMKRGVVGPVLSLAETMDRFARGDMDARVTEEKGATEIREMAHRFNTLAQSLARQHQRRITYIAGIAHDLRNPLSALNSATAIVADPERPLPPEDTIRRALSLVHRQVARLNRMVSDLLDSARIEAGDLSLNLEVADLRKVVEEVVDLFSGHDSLHWIRLDLPDHPVLVRCDMLRIEQTLTNLVSNAIKYSPSGGEIRIALRRDGSNALLSVIDHGIGIEERDLPRLWEPFHRGSASTELIPGAGLGLSICKRIVDAHGGTITVKSTVGLGSTFSIVLPLLDAGAIAKPSDSSDRRAEQLHH